MSIKASFKQLVKSAKEKAEEFDSLVEAGMKARGMNDNAALSAESILGLVIVVVIAAAALPTAITTFFSANTSGWTDPATLALWGLIPMIIIAVIVMKFWKGK